MSIERVEQALAAGTPGPWTTFGGWDVFHTIAFLADHKHQWSVALPDDGSVPGFMRDPEADARLIVALHNLAPRFIDVVRAARPMHESPYHRSMAPDCPLCRALAALDTAIQEELPKEGSDD